MWIYILTFILGIFIDLHNSPKLRSIRRAYIGWLYVFLCFSYTNGSDWRSYELGYDEGYLVYLLSGFDLGFVAIMNCFHYLFSDFWLTLGILKCVYLYSCIKVIQQYTDKWIMVLQLMLPLSLLYMLIDNPLRFMVAMTFFNFAIIMVLKSKYIYAMILSIVAVTCHSASLFCVFLLPALKIDLFSKYKSKTLLAVYIILLLLSSSFDYMLQFQKVLSNVLENYLGRSGLSEYYSLDESDNFLSIGTIINFSLFCLILNNRKLIAKIKNNLFSNTILYFYIYNVAHVIPVGHRIRMAFTFFCCISYVIVMLNINKYKLALSILFVLMLVKNLWVSYGYIPYTNSIPYIITTHKPYDERSNYNLINYKERTGRDHLLEN